MLLKRKPLDGSNRISMRFRLSILVGLVLAVPTLALGQAPLGEMNASLRNIPPIDVAIDDQSDTLAAAGLPASAFRDSIRAVLKEFHFPLSDTAYSGPGLQAPVLYVRANVFRDSLGQESFVASLQLLERVPFARASSGSSIVAIWSFWSDIVPVRPGRLRQGVLGMTSSLVLLLVQSRGCAEDPCKCGQCSLPPGQ